MVVGQQKSVAAFRLVSEHVPLAFTSYRCGNRPIEIILSLVLEPRVASAFNIANGSGVRRCVFRTFLASPYGLESDTQFTNNDARSAAARRTTATTTGRQKTRVLTQVVRVCVIAACSRTRQTRKFNRPTTIVS